ncbi:hypothetical protein LCGC14_2032400, partial [marine sediment metagenome]
ENQIKSYRLRKNENFSNFYGQVIFNSSPFNINRLTYFK